MTDRPTVGKILVMPPSSRTLHPAAEASPRRRARALVHRPGLGAIAVAVTLVGAGTAAANDWVAIFETRTVAGWPSTSADDESRRPVGTTSGRVEPSPANVRKCAATSSGTPGIDSR